MCKLNNGTYKTDNDTVVFGVLCDGDKALTSVLHKYISAGCRFLLSGNKMEQSPLAGMQPRVRMLLVFQGRRGYYQILAGRPYNSSNAEIEHKD